MKSIAWIGTGLLGSGFVESAIKRGLDVRVWNRTITKAQALEQKGAKVFTTPEQAVSGVDRVHFCLSDDTAVEWVLEKITPVLAKGSVIIDHTTVSPQGAIEREKKLREASIDFLSCPVFMGPINALQNTGRMLCGGASHVVEKYKSELQAMTGELIQLGENVAKPCALKLVGNSLIIGLTGVLADTFAIGAQTGLGVEEINSFVSTFPFGMIVAGRGARMVKGDYSASFELSMARKDIRLMLEATEGQPMGVLPGLAQRMDQLIEQGHASADLGILSVDTIPAAKK